MRVGASVLVSPPGAPILLAYISISRVLFSFACFVLLLLERCVLSDRKSLLLLFDRQPQWRIHRGGHWAMPPPPFQQLKKISTETSTIFSLDAWIINKVFTAEYEQKSWQNAWKFSLPTTTYYFIGSWFLFFQIEAGKLFNMSCVIISCVRMFVCCAVIFSCCVFGIKCHVCHNS